LVLNFTHYAASFFVNNNVPFSAANIYLNDLLQCVGDRSLVAEEGKKSRLSFVSHPREVKQFFLFGCFHLFFHLFFCTCLINITPLLLLIFLLSPFSNAEKYGKEV
jgi:hypothetical protein